MRHFARLVAHHPMLVLAAVALATAVALHGIVDLRTGTLRLTVDPSIDRLLPEGDEERLFYDRARRTFGSDEFVLLVLSADDVFRSENLERLARITKRVEALPGVQRALSLANATDIRGEEAEIYVGPFFESVPRDGAALAQLRERVLAHPIYAGNLVSRSGDAAAVLIYYDDPRHREIGDAELSRRIAAVGDEERGDARVYITGTPHVKAEIGKTLLAELRKILPAIFAIAALLSFAAFRSARGVIVPLASIAISLIWTLGAMGWSDTPLNLVSNIVPPLVITLGFAAAIHVVAEYYETLRHVSPQGREAHRAAVRRVLEEMGLAVAVNGFTTGLGFLSLAVSPVTAVRDFGVWAVVGVSATTVVSLTFVPAVLALLGAPSRRRAPAGEGRVDRLAEKLGEFDVRRRRAILALALIVLAVSLAGVTRIRIANEYVRNFAADAPLRVDYEAINRMLGGANPFYIVIESHEDGAFTRPENLHALGELQKWLEAQPEIGKATSIADPVRLLNRAFHGDAPAAFAIPDQANRTRQLLFFAGEDATRGLVDARLRTANVVARAMVSDSESIRELVGRIDARLAELPPNLKARVTGNLAVLNRTVDSIARGQLQSLGGALLTIYLTLAALLTSWRVGLVALFPNLLPIAIYYGTLGLLDLPLTISTSLIGSIALGIAVDDTVHYFTRFNMEARRLGDERRATITTLRSVIRPVTFTTVGLCLGFLTLTLSDLRTQVQFGLLSAFTLAVAWILEITLSPALCSRVRLVTLWDVLGIDLGRDPHRQIPLFDGLSSRQARIFALMSRMVSAPSGTRLLSEGEKGGELFVVIDGELAVTSASGGSQVAFSRLRRGDVVGEMASLVDTRIADVDVVEDARLLRFGDDDLERLARRYPRIAAQVFRNLNRILAERVLSTRRALLDLGRRSEESAAKPPASPSPFLSGSGASGS